MKIYREINGKVDERMMKVESIKAALKYVRSKENIAKNKSRFLIDKGHEGAITNRLSRKIGSSNNI